jgi:tetratricopeptide (TPR) repeat protein
MATVYLAEDLKHNRRVAIKVLLPALASALGPERFLREIKLTAQLNHPHILPVLDSGEAAGLLYYVMPFVDGESLRGRMDREKQLPIEDALLVSREVADALSYAHSQSVVHRDIKPENILISAGHAVVADFGIARAISAAGAERLTETGLAIGTPAYMSPEQAAGSKDLDGRTDLYSLGCVLFEMLAGEPPFTGPTAESVVRQHLAVEPPAVTNLRPTVPARVSEAIARSLAKAPADRFSSVAKFAAALRGDTQTASGQATSERNRSAHRRRWIAAATLIVVAGATATRVAWRRGQGSDPGSRLVVVPPFENRTGDTSLADLGELAASWVADALVREGTAEVVAPTIVQDLLRGDLRSSTKPAEDLARRTGARIAVVGEYRRRGTQVEFRIVLMAMPGATTLAVLDPVVGAADGTALLAALELRVLVALNNQFVLGGESPQGYSRPSSVEAYRQYARGSEFFARSEFAQAVEYLSKAALDTAWTPPLVELASAYYGWGQRQKADSVLRIAERRHNTLRPVEGDNVEWIRGWLSGDQAMEYRAARRLFDRAPRGYAYALAVTANRTHRPHEAVRAAMRRDTTSMEGREWFPWYAVTTAALHLVGDYRRELVVALERRRRFPVEALGLDLEIAARAAMGQLDEVRRLLNQATGKPTGFDGGPGLAFTEFLAHGQESAANAILPQVLSIYEGFATQPGAVRTDTVAFATALFAAKDYRRSRELWQQLAAQDSSGQAHRALALLAAREGDRERALRESEQWQNPVPFFPGLAFFRRAEVAADMGDRPRALAMLRQAFAQGYPFNSAIHRNFHLQSIWSEPAFRELMRPKD